MSPAAPKRRNDSAQARRAILQAALEEFAEHGHAGARIDAISARAGMSKPMLYSYFGDKDALYAAALREAYVQIREAEAELHLEDLDPQAAIGALVSFTLDHFIGKPWFISMLNTENLRGGSTIREIGDAAEIQSHLLTQLGEVLRRGAEAGVFRDGVDPVDLYITVASLCYFPVSNTHTLGVVFKRSIEDPAWLERRRRDAQQLVLGFLRPRPTEGPPE